MSPARRKRALSSSNVLLEDRRDRAELVVGVLDTPDRRRERIAEDPE